MQEEVTNMTEPLLRDNPYNSILNLDNFASHENEQGDKVYAASKHWMKTDPCNSDDKSLQNAPSNAVYLLLKNKNT